MVSKGDSSGDGGDALGLWDGNPIKLDCEDYCTTINAINAYFYYSFLSNKNKKKQNGDQYILFLFNQNYLKETYSKTGIMSKQI